MTAFGTLKEIDSLLSGYLARQCGFFGETDISTPELTLIEQELHSCQQHERASLKLRDYARIVSYYHEESKEKRCPTYDALGRAVRNYEEGMDVTKAIKRARLVN